ncbi:MAG TPA: hypothetical protein VGD50_00680, partial [Candidatus Baltobacteraceae bacterium]
MDKASSQVGAVMLQQRSDTVSRMQEAYAKDPKDPRTFCGASREVGVLHFRIGISMALACAIGIGAPSLASAQPPARPIGNAGPVVCPVSVLGVDRLASGDLANKTTYVIVLKSDDSSAASAAQPMSGTVALHLASQRFDLNFKNAIPFRNVPGAQPATPLVIRVPSIDLVDSAYVSALGSSTCSTTGSWPNYATETRAEIQAEEDAIARAPSEKPVDLAVAADSVFPAMPAQAPFACAHPNISPHPLRIAQARYP